MMTKKNCYIIDTCSLVDLNRHNPIDIFPTLWSKIDKLVQSDLLISHKEVFNEINQQDDQLVKWAKRNKKMFKEITERQSEIVAEILKKFPSLIDIDKQFVADPWIIALAKEMKEDPQRTLFDIKKLIVTEEGYKSKKVKIPLVCKSFDIDCINRVEMFREENWKF
jgi:hypothetical protein